MTATNHHHHRPMDPRTPQSGHIYSGWWLLLLVLLFLDESLLAPPRPPLLASVNVMKPYNVRRYQHWRRLLIFNLIESESNINCKLDFLVLCPRLPLLALLTVLE